MPNSALGALLQIAGLIQHQHRARVAQTLDHVAAQVVPHPVVIPHRPRQQVLHPVRVGLPGVFGHRPTVDPWQFAQQPAHHHPDPAAWLDPGEPGCDAAHQLVVLPLPSVNVYAVASGHRMVMCLHKPRSSAVAVPSPGNATPARSRTTTAVLGNGTTGLVLSAVDELATTMAEAEFDFLTTALPCLRIMPPDTTRTLFQVVAKLATAHAGAQAAAGARLAANALLSRAQEAVLWGILDAGLGHLRQPSASRT